MNVNCEDEDDGDDDESDALLVGCGGGVDATAESTDPVSL